MIIETVPTPTRPIVGRVIPALGSSCVITGVGGAWVTGAEGQLQVSISVQACLRQRPALHTRSDGQSPLCAH